MPRDGAVKCWDLEYASDRMPQKFRTGSVLRLDGALWLRLCLENEVNGGRLAVPEGDFVGLCAVGLMPGG